MFVLSAALTYWTGPGFFELVYSGPQAMGQTSLACASGLVLARQFILISFS